MRNLFLMTAAVTCITLWGGSPTHAAPLSCSAISNLGTIEPGFTQVRLVCERKCVWRHMRRYCHRICRHQP